MKRLSSVVSANRLVASGWIEVSLGVSAVREKSSSSILFYFVMYYH